MKFFRNFFNKETAARNWFLLILVVSSGFWVLFGFLKGLKKIDLPQQPANPIVSFDQSSYKLTKQYLDVVDNYVLSTTTQSLINSEPFAEYQK